MLHLTFELTLNNIYDSSLSGADMVDKTNEQFDILENWLLERMTVGKLDVNGWTLQNDSMSFQGSEIICEAGTTAEYSTFTCREFFCFLLQNLSDKHMTSSQRHVGVRLPETTKL